MSDNLDLETLKSAFINLAAKPCREGDCGGLRCLSKRSAELVLDGSLALESATELMKAVLDDNCLGQVETDYSDGSGCMPKTECGHAQGSGYLLNFAKRIFDEGPAAFEQPIDKIEL